MFPFRRFPEGLPPDLEGGEQPFAPEGGSPVMPGPALTPGSRTPGISAQRVYLRGKFLQIPFLAQTTPLQIRPEEPTRSYFFMINFSLAAQIFIGFDTEPNAANAIPLAVNLGFYEPYVVPTNAIIVTATAANTPGILVIATTD